jgi:polysaccharide pyruvyl transferase WcaK-like protein
MPTLVFDTAAGSTNLGDHIIMDAVNPLVDELLYHDFVLNVSSHMAIHPLHLLPFRKYQTALVGGTNLLKNNMLNGRQWQVGLKELFVLRHKVVLFGVGWWQYQEQPVNAYTSFLYRNLLSKNMLHAVRDQYTLEKLKSTGINNVVNTGCPTTWMLDEPHCLQINPHKKDIVVTTVTDYLRDPEKDRIMLETLKKNYKEVHVWIQGSKDQAYIESLTTNISYIAPKLSAFDRFLEQENCEYIGTRLHAGIRALQKKRKALIIGIDNRAIEMRNDVGLPVLERQRMDQLEQFIAEETPIRIYLNKENIQQWKSQFARTARKE